MAHVLIADDDEDIRDLLDMTVASMGHTTQCVADGAAAIDALSAAQFDLAILDVAMPSATGVEVVTAARSSSPTRELPIMLVSAYSTTADIERGLDAGADAYLTKPVSLMELRARVTGLLTH